MRPLPALFVALLLVCGASAAVGAVPQTIVIDGTNDFDPSNQLDDDTGDTQSFCNPGERPLDLGKVYLTNDATYLYFGFEYRRFCFTDIDLGLAIDVNTAAGGTTDPFSRKIAWNTVPNKPDFVIYDVIPHPGNTFNFEALYQWTGGPSWATVQSGSNNLGIADADGGTFVEGRILLSTLGVVSNNTIRVEYWVTQEGATKGPLDAACGDAVQMSRFTTTTFDTTANVEMPCLIPYTIQNSVDNLPPIVSNALAVGFPLLANKQFNTATNKIDVTFSEPVSAATANTAGNYAVTGPSTPAVISAIRDAGFTNIVHLTLGSTISANAAFRNVTVQNVQDLAGNTIVNNGNTNVGSFFIENLAFEGDMRLRLCKGEFASTDTFAVEGSLSPLTFTIADNARMYDANTDSIYTVTVPFAMPKDRTSGKAEADLLWKLSHTPAGDAFEPGANRMYHLSSDSGATRTLRAAWANDNPDDYTDKPVDVVFQVDARRLLRGGPHHIWLVGGQPPLGFNRPGLPMSDNGVSPDLVANDSIYTKRVRFPRCTPKNVAWKVVYDSTAADTVYECPGQGDRNVFVNSASFDTVGGAHGQLTLPARGINRCSVTDKAVAVQFRVLVTPAAPNDTVAVIGNRPPLNSDRPPSAASILKDNGVAPDFRGGDKIYTGKITFPDSTNFTVNFKYWLNSFNTNFGFECEGEGDRSHDLDDVNFSAANPMIRGIDVFDTCATITAVTDGPPSGGGGAAFALLRPGFPNPLNPRTTISFDLRRGGRVSLTIRDIAGRRVATLVDRDLPPGTHSLVWDGRDSGGSRVRSGVYFCELASNGERLARRLVVTR
jgi:hypothetical protein